METKITILGAGSWGITVANIIANNNVKTVLYTNDEECVDEINKKHTNIKYIQGELNKNISASTDLSEATKNSNYIFIILPSKVVSGILENLKSLNTDFEQKFVIFTKGMDVEKQKFFNEIVLDNFPNAEIAILSGPNFAEEVAEKKSTITTLACKNKQYFNKLENILNCDYFRIKYFEDLKAVQLCGLVKNVLAILCGISEGLDLGRNTFSALLIKGIEEIEILCKKYNCDEKVINTPAGIGDIVLTCSSKKSRNMSFGFRIGTGENIQEILKSSNSTIEGLINAKTLFDISKKFQIKNSISEIVLDIVNNNYSKEKLKQVILENYFNY